MFDKVKKFFTENMPNFYSIVSTVAVTLLGLLLIFFLFKELYSLFVMTLATESSTTFYEIVDNLLTFFLFLEFLSLVIVFIKEKGHTPLRFFIYLGVTALLRTLLTLHDSAMDILLISSSIFLLLVGLTLINRGKDLE
ncbi:phosphate-starvation-inducible PsiE family protein [Lactobacillus terrae]|uniref:phosphate-starvation-inducible PsiE family protein n=1 Tax=Lactobacillus terrae TaxID=2269374 RepID=UPI000C1B78EB|nr:phosphate-starvation-inducible PsiE family protein [Lactobacillus terrae]